MQPNNPKGACGNETTDVPAYQYHAGVDRTLSPGSNTVTAELSEQQVRREREELERMRRLDQELRNRGFACDKEQTPARHRRPLPIIDSPCVNSEAQQSGPGFTQTQLPGYQNVPVPFSKAHSSLETAASSEAAVSATTCVCAPSITIRIYSKRHLLFKLLCGMCHIFRAVILS